MVFGKAMAERVEGVILNIASMNASAAHQERRLPPAKAA